MLFDPCRQLYTVLMRSKKGTESITDLCKLLPSYWSSAGNLQFHWATPFVKVCLICINFIPTIKGSFLHHLKVQHCRIK